MRLILASTSPRRREILALLGVPFEVVAPKFDEVIAAQLPIEEEVLDFAAGKANSVVVANPDSIVVGCDTMISFDGEKVGKPTDEADARRILRLLSGKMHRIYTSVAIIDGGGPGLRMVETVEVDMRPFKADEIECYLATGESMDKAGAYSVQGEGRSLIAAIRGDYLAAVGMPLKPIAGYLKGRIAKFPCDVDKIYRDKTFANWRSFD
jgi:septum formation protein